MSPRAFCCIDTRLYLYLLNSSCKFQALCKEQIQRGELLSEWRENVAKASRGGTSSMPTKRQISRDLPPQAGRGHRKGGQRASCKEGNICDVCLSTRHCWVSAGRRCRRNGNYPRQRKPPEEAKTWPLERTRPWCLE